MAKEPNLFSHATSELSQDAFLAWLCEWADEAHALHPSGMHAVGRAFIAWFYQKKGRPLPEYRSVEVKLQHLHIDVLVILTTALGEKHYLLIEDKTYTSDHTEQINGYVRSLTETEGIEDTSRILPVYFKSSLEARKRDDHLRLYLPDVVEFIKSVGQSIGQSEVLRSWCQMQTDARLSHERFRSLPMDQWEPAQWRGCFDRMAQHEVLLALDAAYEFGPLNKPMVFHLQRNTAPTHWRTYVQIDAHSRSAELTFRIAAPHGMKVDGGRTKAAFQAIQATAASLNQRLVSPASFTGRGATSRIAAHAERFVPADGSGIFDETRFVERVIAGHEILANSAERLQSILVVERM